MKIKEVQRKILQRKYNVYYYPNGYNFVQRKRNKKIFLCSCKTMEEAYELCEALRKQFSKRIPATPYKIDRKPEFDYKFE